jgi:hypothetical protein
MKRETIQPELIAPMSDNATYTLVTEPDQGLIPLYNLLSSAKKSIPTGSSPGFAGVAVTV